MKVVLAAITIALGLSAPAVALAAGMVGVWCCNADGTITLGVLTISGGNYGFAAVRDSRRTPKPEDKGSGTFTASGVVGTPHT